jgi:hypothetical protein
MDFPMFFTASQVNVLGSEDREPRQAKPPPKLCTTLNIKIQMEARSSQTSVSWSGRMAVPAPLSPDRGLATRIGRRLKALEELADILACIFADAQATSRLDAPVAEQPAYAGFEAERS